MKHKITDEILRQMEIYALTGLYTINEIYFEFDEKYSVSQIRYHLKNKRPMAYSQIKKESSAGVKKLKYLLAQIFPDIKIQEEVHVGKRLRLDLYIDSPYYIAFEFDGVQHFKYTPGLHKSDNDLLAGKERDQLKEDLCKGRGISLVRISYLEDLTLDLLRQKIKDAGYGTGKVQKDFLTSKERKNIYDKQMSALASKRRKEYAKSIKQTDFYRQQKERQKEFRKTQYKKYKEWKKQIAQSK